MKTSDIGLHFSNELANQPWLPYRFVEDHPESFYWGTASTNVGGVTLAFADEGIAYLGFEEGRSLQKLSSLFPSAGLKEDRTAAKTCIMEYLSYWTGAAKPSVALPFIIKGTAFQKSVWTALMSIPLGDVVSYGCIARSIGKPQAVRAVGSAVGANPISLLIPCHRVVQQSGAIENYGWGNAIKQNLLRTESLFFQKEF